MYVCKTGTVKTMYFAVQTGYDALCGPRTVHSTVHSTVRCTVHCTVGTTVGSTFDDVRRALVRSLDASTSLDGDAAAAGRPGDDDDLLPGKAAAFPADEDRQLLRDLRGAGRTDAVPPADAGDQQSRRLWAYYNCDSSTIRVRFEHDTTSYEELCAFEQ